MLTRGLGRSYGDASLPPPGRGPVASSLGATRVLEFDEDSGRLRAEAGLRLSQLIDLFLPRGFFVPVSPGTREVTLGGMLAADVHGKNHHVAGCIGEHVEEIRLRLPDGSIEQVSESRRGELFRATLGGMGLTGHILDATLRLERVPSPAFVEDWQRHADLESLIDGLERASAAWPFTVAWTDLLARGGSLGRGTLQCGRWATGGEAASQVYPSRSRAPRRGGTSLRLPVPLTMPPWLLSNATVAACNGIRYQAGGRQAGQRICSAQDFFYPLDGLAQWNRLYGRRGLTQYQCVLPRDPSMRSYRRLVEVARSEGPGPFLAVIKDCGAEGRGMLSFPKPGLSFALDFPVHERTPALVARLNDVVADAGGRIYLAKDAFTTAGHFAAMEPRLAAFLELRERIDPDRRIESALSARLFPRTGGVPAPAHEADGTRAA